MLRWRFMNQIENITVKKELKYNDTVVLKYIIEYPQIVSTKYMYGKLEFNRYNKLKAIELQNEIERDLYEEAVKLYKYNMGNGYPLMIYEIAQKYNLTYNKDNLVSIYIDKYIFSGGAHGNTIRSSQNWNLRSANLVPLSFFYYDNQNYVAHILNEILIQICRQIQNGENQYFEDYCSLAVQNFKVDNYYLLPNYIVIFYQQYDIAPYSNGTPVFKIRR